MSVNIDTEGMIAFIRRLNKKQVGNYKRRKVYLYSKEGTMVKTFETTDECADYFGYPREYIYHNLKYCKKIRKKDKEKWYVISRNILYQEEILERFKKNEMEEK